MTPIPGTVTILKSISQTPIFQSTEQCLHQLHFTTQTFRSAVALNIFATLLEVDFSNSLIGDWDQKYDQSAYVVKFQHDLKTFRNKVFEILIKIVQLL